MSAELEEFDLERVYDEQINPLMAQIIAICKENNMPFLASFCYANSEEGDGPGLCTSMILPENRTPRQLYAAHKELFRTGGFIAFTITEKQG